MVLRYTAYDLNNSLNVAAQIFNMTSGSPIFVETLAMAPLGSNGTYVLPLTAPNGQTYVANMMVYTDGTFITPDLNYTPADAEIDAQSGGGGSASAGCATIGIVEPPPTVIGIVASNPIVIGLVVC